jgi:hypothetical protein
LKRPTTTSPKVSSRHKATGGKRMQGNKD